MSKNTSEPTSKRKDNPSIEKVWNTESKSFGIEGLKPFHIESRLPFLKKVPKPFHRESIQKRYNRKKGKTLCKEKHQYITRYDHNFYGEPGELLQEENQLRT